MMFWKIWKNEKFSKFQGKTPMLESLSNKVAGVTPTQMFFYEICEIFKNTYFEKYLWTTAPV